MTIDYRPLGRNGIRVSPLCLGTMMFGGETDEQTSQRIIGKVRDLGFNFIDTADGYAAGQSEVVTGAAIRPDRDRWILSTKFASPRGTDPNSQGASRKYIRRAVEGSLRRLGTDYIDIYYLHREDHLTNTAETLRALDELIREGKIRYYGLSNHRAWKIAEFSRLADHLGIDRPIATQPLYNLANRQIEFEHLDAADHYGLGVVPYTALHPGVSTPPPFEAKSHDPARPLDGLRIVELGQFTTAPLASRHLAALGAEVLKVEPRSGEPARQWAPIVDGVSHYFTITNTGKRTAKINLRDPYDLDWLKEQIRGCHVLIENMRPGGLQDLGLSPGVLARLNPGLIQCSVSGFGAFSAYPGRAAYDTVIQGMSGMMDLTRSALGPVKLGISAADILGAQVAMLAILSSLARKICGRFIDISMQDIAAYAALLSDDVITLAGPPNTGNGAARTVREIADNRVFCDELLTRVPDEAGNLRHAVRLPYQLD